MFLGVGLLAVSSAFFFANNVVAYEPITLNTVQTEIDTVNLWDTYSLSFDVTTDEGGNYLSLYFNNNGNYYNYVTIDFYTHQTDGSYFKIKKNNVGDLVNFDLNICCQVFDGNTLEDTSRFTFSYLNRNTYETSSIWYLDEDLDKVTFTFTYFMYDESTYDLIVGNGYSSAVENSYNEGYEKGKQDGYNDFRDTQEYQNDIDNAWTSGKNTGYYEGLHTQTYTFTQLFGAIADTPIMIMSNLLGFDVFGVSALSIVMTMLTGCIVFYLIKRIIL